MADQDVSKLKVADLKRELKLRGLVTTGNKTELSERLQAALIEGDGSFDDSAINHDDLLEDDDVLNDDELDDETKSLLDSNHEDAVLKTPPDSVKSKSPEPSSDALSQQRKVVTLKRKLILPEVIAAPSENIAAVPTTTTNVAAAPTISSAAAAVTETLGQVDNKASEDGPEKKVVKLSELTAKERLEMRAKKFGAPLSADALKQARAEKYGIATAATSTDAAASGGKINSNVPAAAKVSVDVLKKRAERFGGSVSKVMNKIENNEKLQKRQERFQITATTTTKTPITVSSTDFAEKARLRLERFKPVVK